MARSITVWMKDDDLEALLRLVNLGLRVTWGPYNRQLQNVAWKLETAKERLNDGSE